MTEPHPLEQHWVAQEGAFAAGAPQQCVLPPDPALHQLYCQPWQHALHAGSGIFAQLCATAVQQLLPPKCFKPSLVWVSRTISVLLNYGRQQPAMCLCCTTIL
eukprot:GHRQ01025815.1.p4 GENE.GHRQ01025815.1~~GHRQ01025815.1.p4  ORF type:complete len:103 (+),score=30.24 GHRQ01025815.1:285-593(+)